MYYKILVNGNEIGTFGHENIKNIHLVVGGDSKGIYTSASAVCDEDGKNYLIDWPQYEISPNDRVEIIPTSERNVNKPRKKYEMKPK